MTYGAAKIVALTGLWIIAYLTTVIAIRITGSRLSELSFLAAAALGYAFGVATFLGWKALTFLSVF